MGGVPETRAGNAGVQQAQDSIRPAMPIADQDNLPELPSKRPRGR